MVCKIGHSLRNKNIPVWFNEQGNINNIHDTLADGVENATVVCCFLTPDYEESIDCKFELQYAQKRFKNIILCLVTDTKIWKPSEWLQLLITDHTCIEFDDVSEADIDYKTTELIYYIHEQPTVSKHRLSTTIDRPSYLFELVKYKYQQNSRIERVMNPEISFPIEQSYINLVMVKARDQHEQENQFRNLQEIDAVMENFEKIYGIKTAIEVKNMFASCKDPQKRVLVLGRAGIGKSTFCRYVAYQWATGSYWPQYELLALIPLRRLTTNRYPSNKEYSLIDLVKKEAFRYDLTEKDEILLKEQFDARKILWILDGYDEIMQNVPPHLEYLLEQLCETPHHILTSRPYLNTLSYDVQMEIVGFTDKDIEKYVQQFFDQIKDELDDPSTKSKTLLKFLKFNHSIWGVAHIPVNLELICSLWSNEDWSETKELTITTLYTMMTEWLCRRYLASQNHRIQKLSEHEVYQYCQKELTFLESLAFNAMESNTIVIPPRLLEKALDEANVSLQERPYLLNIGVLKSFKKQGIGTQIELKKDHYFIHLSFQEYFAARYIIKALEKPSSEKVIQFIKHQKYNQRYTLVFTFASGLVFNNDQRLYSNTFWDIILGEPLDLVGIRHMQLVISCLEATSNNSNVPQCIELLEWIAKCISYNGFIENNIVLEHILQSLQRTKSVVCVSTIMSVLINLLQCSEASITASVFSFISLLQISNLPSELIITIIQTLSDEKENVRLDACVALSKMGEKVATSEVINKLVTTALGDDIWAVRKNACIALGNMGDKVATTDVISKLLSAIEDQDIHVRVSACEVLGKIHKQTVSHEVISKLVSAAGDQNISVRVRACEALRMLGEIVATDVVISKLLSALKDENEDVIWNVCTALRKMFEKVATSEVISKLINALGDQEARVRRNACRAFESIGEKAATEEVISKLVSAVGDQDISVRESACEALGRMGKKAATNEVISKLVSAVGDQETRVSRNACRALASIVEKGATNEVISKLISAAGDNNSTVRRNACIVFGNMGDKVATTDVISKLLSAVGDQDINVRVSACRALESIGENAVTDEVINKLVTAVEDKEEDVRVSACEALGRMGAKATTDEVINKLVSAVEDKEEDVRVSACEALGRMGEKAATDEVISKLVSAVGDKEVGVIVSACHALERMGEKAATNEVISKLVNAAIGDGVKGIRWYACAAVAKIGDETAMNQVISKLMSALEDKDWTVRSVVYDAIEKMGEKAANNEVISMLASAAVGDELKGFRLKACGALASIGGKAATDEVIKKLVSALEDQDVSVRFGACYALVKMGEKAVRNDVINGLAIVLNSNDFWHYVEAIKTVENMLTSLDSVSQLEPKVIVNLCSSKYGRNCMKNFSASQLINIFVNTKNPDWLVVITELILRRGAAVTVTENKVVVYDRGEPTEISISAVELRNHLIKSFTNKAKELHLSFQ